MNWFKYIVIAYLPLTVFYCLVLLLKMSATTGSVNSLITIIQVCTSPGIVRFHYASHSYHTTIDWAMGVFSVLNLDFFKLNYHPFCLHPSMTTIQVFSLEYLVGVYPLLLVAITYFLVKLHDRYSIVVYLWRPCYRVSLANSTSRHLLFKPLLPSFSCLMSRSAMCPLIFSLQPRST